MSKKIINQFLFERGQDQYQTTFQGISKSANLVVNKYDKSHTTVLNSFPSVVNAIGVVTTDVYHIFSRDGVTYGVARDPANSKQTCILEFTLTGYTVKASNTFVNLDIYGTDGICSCQVGKYQYVVYPDAAGTAITAYDTVQNKWLEITTPAEVESKLVAYATSICYWAGHVFINDRHSDHVFYSRANPDALTGEDFTKQFLDASGAVQYRALAYKDGVNLWTGVINHQLWSVSSSYLQQWTVTDSALVPIYANTDNILELHTTDIAEIKSGIVMNAKDLAGNPHIYMHTGKLETIESDEVLAGLTIDYGFISAYSFGWFKDHEYIVFRFVNGIQAYDRATGLWTTLDSAMWNNTCCYTDTGYLLKTTDKTTVFRIAYGSDPWNRAGAVWLQDHSDFYCDRVSFKFQAKIEKTVTIKYRMRRENESSDGWVTEQWTIGSSPLHPSEPETYDLQIANCGYGGILELDITTSAALYDCRAYITAGGRF